MKIQSICSCNDDLLIQHASRIDGTLFSVSDKKLSFIAFDDNDNIVGYVFLRGKDIPNNYIIRETFNIQGHGCEILQLLIINHIYEPEILKRVITRISMWRDNNNILFNYCWSVNIGDNSQFISYVLDCDISEVLIAPNEKRLLVFSELPNE